MVLIHYDNQNNIDSKKSDGGCIHVNFLPHDRMLPAGECCARRPHHADNIFRLSLKYLNQSRAGTRGAES